MNYPTEHFKCTWNMYSAAFGWNILRISFKFNGSFRSFKTSIVLLIFCLEHLSIHITGVLKSHIINILLSLSAFMYVAAAAAAKSLQSCPTLCDPIDSSPPGSAIPGILQARTLEWVAIAFSSAWKWKVKVKSLSRVRLLATPWTAAHHVPPSMGFSRQEYWSGVPLPSLLCMLELIYFVVVQLLICVWFFVTPWIVVHQASFSFTISWNLLKLMSIELVMPSNRLVLCCSLLFLPPIPPSIRIFYNDSVLHIRWPKYWSFSFSISSSNEYSGLISFRIDWFDLLSVQGTLKNILQHHN